MISARLFSQASRGAARGASGARVCTAPAYEKTPEPARRGLRSSREDDPREAIWRCRMTAAARSRATGCTRAVVAEFLRRHPGSTPKAIALGAGLSRELAKRTALRMAADGELTTAGRGHYFWVPPPRRHLAVVPGDGEKRRMRGTPRPLSPPTAIPRASRGAVPSANGARRKPR
jgi:hypothetical protein